MTAQDAIAEEGAYARGALKAAVHAKRYGLSYVVDRARYCEMLKPNYFAFATGYVNEALMLASLDECYHARGRLVRRWMFDEACKGKTVARISGWMVR